MRNFIWRCWLALVAGAAVMLSGGEGRADDTFPPCWRGLPDTTVQVWNFSTAANPAGPDTALNPYGSPQAVIAPGSAAAGWIDTRPVIFGTNRSGIWELGSSGSIAFTIPNAPSAPALSWKYVHVQVTQYRDGLYSQLATVSIPGATLVRSQIRTNESLIGTNYPFNGRWAVHHSVWLIEPCPASEVVTISSSATRSAAIDSVVIDTRCATSDTGDMAVPCWRGTTGSTFQNWSFHRNNNPAAPELVHSPGSPQAGVTLGALALGWQDEIAGFGCRQGYWDLGSGGSMALAIPNTAGSVSSYKNIQVQVVEFQDSLAYNQLAGVSIPGATLLSQEQTTLEMTLTGSWVAHRSLWRLAPCPSAETVVITAPPGSALIDQVVVDTLCLDWSTACPSSQTLPADAGQCSRANVTWSLPLADGCIIASAVCSPPSGSSFNVGTSTVNCTITDIIGGSSTCSFQVTIQDTQAPAVSCPSDMLVRTAITPALCGAIVNFTATASDNCPGATVTCSPASGAVFPLGVTAVTCVARDASLNLSAPCSFNVTVLDISGDVQPPCWRGRPGSTYQHWTFTDNDNPAAPELVFSPDNPLAVITPGPLNLGWQAGIFGFGCKQGYWDLGNGGTITLAIPNWAPAPGAAKNVRLQVTEFRDTLAYNVSPTKTVPGATLISQRETSIETTVTGEWIVHESIWRFATCPASETIVITAPPTSALIDQIVVDTFCALPPVCPPDIAGVTDSGLCVKSGITWSLPAPDGCTVQSVVCQTNGVVVTQPASFPIGQTMVNCAIVDAENYTNNCAFVVTIDDLQPPVIATCAPPQSAFASALCQALVPDFTVGVAATDCNGPLVVTQVPAAGTLVGLGTTLVTLTVKDAANNTATCTANFVVTDTTPPVIASCAPGQLGAADALCQAMIPDFTAGVVASDCNGPLVVTQVPAAGTLVGLGTTLVTLTVKDAANNTTTCTTSFVVTDTTAPVIATCAPNQSAVADALCQATVPDFTAGVVATDCNGPLVITQSPAAGTSVGLGTSTVTLTVKDAANNSATCTANFVVSPAADLAVSVVATPATTLVGQPVTYSVTVTNLGGCTAADLVLSDLLSPGQVLLGRTNVGAGTMSACPAPGAVAWWAAEGDAQDKAGANHGLAAGGAAYAAGQVGQAFSFDGLTGVVAVPDAPALRPASLTIEGWVKIQDPNGVHVIVSKPRGSGMEESFAVWISSGTLHAGISDAGGSGAFLTHPDFPTSSLFVATDVVNLPSLAAKLKVPADPVSTYLNGLLSAPTLNLLALYAGGADLPLLRALVADLNTIIQGGSIYDGPRFAGVTLAPETAYLLGRNPSGIDLVRLNRLLVRDAYPAEIASVLFPELNQWFHVAYTFDDSSKVQALYVNGELVDVGVVNKTITYDPSALLIGAGNSNGTPGFFYQGLVDELAIYNRALSGLEVEAIHGAGVNGKCAGSGPLSLGSLAAGESVTVVLTVMPVQCPSVSLTATVASSTFDPAPANNQATASVTVADHAPGTIALSIRRVSINNNYVRISWPLTCAPYVLQGTPSLDEPIVWSPSALPLQVIDGSHSTVVHADDVHHFFRLFLP